MWVRCGEGSSSVDLLSFTDCGAAIVILGYRNKSDLIWSVQHAPLIIHGNTFTFYLDHFLEIQVKPDYCAHCVILWCNCSHSTHLRYWCGNVNKPDLQLWRKKSPLFGSHQKCSSLPFAPPKLKKWHFPAFHHCGCLLPPVCLICLTCLTCPLCPLCLSVCLIESSVICHSLPHSLFLASVESSRVIQLQGSVNTVFSVSHFGSSLLWSRCHGNGVWTISSAWLCFDWVCSPSSDFIVSLPTLRSL